MTFSGGELTVAKRLRELGFKVTKIGYTQRSPQIWAFCANPNLYRIKEAVSDVDVDYWIIGRSDIRLGDLAIIWQTNDRQKRRGIVAFGQILAGPEMRSDSKNPYWINPADGKEAVARVPVSYVDAPNLPLWVDDTPEGEFLRSLNVARSQGGTVFRVTIEQWQRIKQLAEAEDQSKQEDELWEQPLERLRERALISSASVRSPEQRNAMVRYRSNAIRVYVLKRANGICEGCGTEAPFRTTAGSPYLEPHHILQLSDGGPDDPNWVIALCPNCHRRAHYGQDSAEYNQRLTGIVRILKSSLYESHSNRQRHTHISMVVMKSS